MEKVLKCLALSIIEKAKEEVLGSREERFSSQYETNGGYLIEYKVTCTITEDLGCEEDGYYGSCKIINFFVECEMLVNSNCINMPNVTSELNYWLSK